MDITNLYNAVKNKDNKSVEKILKLAINDGVIIDSSFTDLGYIGYLLLNLIGYYKHILHIDQRDHSGETVLHYAAKYGDYETLRLLTKLGKADINLQDSRGFPPIILASEAHNKQNVINLIKLGADFSMLYKIRGDFFIPHPDFRIFLQDYIIK